MKKKYTVLAFAAVIMIAATSCEKLDFMNNDKDAEDIIEYRTIEATVNANESYTLVLPKKTSNDPFQITQEPAHSRTSLLSFTPYSYHYTPENNYIGKDQVVISTVEKEQNGQHGNGGNCSSQNKSETQLVLTVNLTIKGVSTATK